MRIRVHHVVMALIFSVLVPCHGALAQQPVEVVRGRVTDDSSRAVIAATVMVTRGPDRLTLSATTDSAGHFRVQFDNGTGDYLVYVSFPSFKTARRRVQRQASEHELVADFTLARDMALLAAVKVTADKPVRATNTVSPRELETGASEKWSDGVNGRISPTEAGDLNATAATMSNITMGALGPSILGSGPESNLSTLNGMNLATGSLPRAARTETRVTGATFDPTRGGFAGANIDVHLGPGDRFYQRRNGFLTLDPPSLQFTDPTGRYLGARSGGFRGSLGADGELIRQALTYNISVDLARTTSDPVTLVDAGPDALLRAGLAPDSVARLVAVANPLGLALTGKGLPSNREHDAFTALARFDDTRDTLRTRAFTTYFGSTTDGALGFGPLAAPSSSGERSERTVGAQLTIGDYVGEGRRVLTETRLSGSAVNTRVSPYRAMPGADVLVRSSALDATSDVTDVTLGGGSGLSMDDRKWTLEGSNETTFNAGGRRHRFRTQIWARADGVTQSGIPNQLGSYSYNSIADLQAGLPSGFSRTLSQPARSGTVWNGAAAIAHQWAPSKFFSLLYGARLEADGFVQAPPRNAALEQALGVTTGAAPNRLHVSPRLGFSYMYNRDKENQNGTNQTPVGRFYRSQTGVIRGGIGEFRDLLRPGILADASASTGLAGGTSALSCVGSAVPSADWLRFASDPASIPTRCADGSGILADHAPPVTLIDPSYDVPHSWRASLDWNASSHSILYRVAGLASYDLSQPGTVDANFAGGSRFTLASENNRPVFVTPASIDPASGGVSPTESRISSQFGRVTKRVSDLRGYGGQLTFGISPDILRFRARGMFNASLNYTIQETRREFRGFDGAGFGDPRQKEWAPGINDARHVVVFAGGFNFPKTGAVTLFARAQSGLPITPLVQGDVNGDGRGGDRAFVPDPTRETDAALAAQIKSLLATGSPTAVSCLSQNFGSVVGRNACRGPWTQSLNMQWRPPTPSRWGGRVGPTIYLQNILSGVDQLAHGSNGLRGWGSSNAPDPILLIPRGYDAAAQRFRYDVNPRFADTRPGRTIALNPFRVVVDFSFNFATDYDVQQLRRALEPVRGIEGVWRRRTADSLAAFYLASTSSVHKVLLEESDSLFLSNAQVLAIRSADSAFSARVRAIYAPLGEFLSKGQGNAGKAEFDSVETTEKEYWRIFWQQPEIADSLITPAQRELMPMLRNMLATPVPAREHSQWQFGHPVTYSDKPKRPDTVRP
ncbi:MAG: hypothetical protein JWL61_704 [Gemmatimonadetes bacterium]|nr:hypothetical protein [Gemmatimonadota bacterium]